MTKLNDVQRQLLEAAAANEDGFIDIPKDGKAAARALIKAALLIATPQDGVEGRCLITTEGRSAVAPAVKAAGRKKTKTTSPVASEPAPAPVPAKLNKTGLMVQLLTQPQGASIAAMSEATGWLPHSVRGFMAGTLKKKLGMTVTSEIVDGLRLYRATLATAA